ncbi:RNA 3'-terminal phosphate cyclase [Cavenderia fasciculata]|uniref:RNA 3'-terminal-phosphate cyclase (ATP) n=1 Tax=Cavenderia fasciculata TaxID=261658 RepID=F4Q7J2_CACFS|nr:RNA 3'-terminal phosphate cyclase [Cavenderia fasciculata]EGG16374.1 RNA 3'-terminal phosphate cyclase [Cavenderia fasciculata]|eukprot:XP_004354758.1 RNA 3'-terminal phosphate cyclase [Cavenderia fasciculata]
MAKTKRNYKPHLQTSKIKPTPENKDDESNGSGTSEVVSDDTIREETPEYTIDGSILEGGGQIIRNCLALASLFNKPIRINKIRNGRDQPGLKAQHRSGVDLLVRLFRAHASGCKVGSTDLYYHPRRLAHEIKDTSIEADTGTAGSITLLLQISLPCLVFFGSSTKLVLGGGTNVAFSPMIDYIAQVFAPAAKLMGVDMDITIDKRGYYPRGCGQTTVITRPLTTEPLKPIEILDRGQVTKIIITSYFTSTRINPSVADRMCQHARKLLKKEFKVEIEERSVDVAKESYGDCAYIFIMAETSTGCRFGASAIGEIKVPAEKVAEDATIQLINDLNGGGCVDEFLQDQLIIFMALAKGTSKIKTGLISLHTETSIHFTSLMTGAKFQVIPDPDGKKDVNIIICDGIGYLNGQNQNQNINNCTTSTSTTTTTTTTTNNTTTTTDS